MKQSDNTTPHKASEYDKNIRETIPFYELFHSETIDLVKLLKPKAKVWLDTGCGTGYLVERAFLHFPYTFFLLADPSKNMLIEAKKRLQQIPPNRIKFIDSAPSEDLSDKLNLQPEVISAIMCHHYLTLEQRRNATQTCFKLLAPGGIYITFENVRPCSENGIELCLERWKQFQISQGRSVKIVEEHRKRFNKKYFPITISEHLSLLKECGFGVVDLLWYSQMQAGFYAIK